MRKIVITTGDSNGIGYEVTAKALKKIKIPQDTQFIVWRSPETPTRYLNKNTKTVSSLDDALKSNVGLVEIVSSKNPALWFEESVKNWKAIDAIVTAPLSKLTIQKSGLRDAGHTDIMRRLVPSKKPIMMAFLGSQFSLLLATDHVAYKNVPRVLTKKKLLDCILAANEFLKLRTSKNKKIGVLGLNPHAGEIKKLGKEEKGFIIPAIKAARKRGLNVEGPLIPDICFQPQNIAKYAIYIAMYHDQGLIPFKIHHKYQRGIQVSVNLPFIRTSVDHGTAADIFGKNKADPSSMLMAIQKALDWC